MRAPALTLCIIDDFASLSIDCESERHPSLFLRRHRRSILCHILVYLRIKSHLLTHMSSSGSPFDAALCNLKCDRKRVSGVGGHERMHHLLFPSFFSSYQPFSRVRGLLRCLCLFIRAFKVRSENIFLICGGVLKRLRAKMVFDL